jgi:pilus assembly protein CpaC
MSPVPVNKGDEIVMGFLNVRHLMTMLLGAAVLLSAATQESAMAQGVDVKRITGNYAGALVVPLNKSEVLEVDKTFKRVTVGNPEIADVLPLSDRTIYVLGKQIGLTNLDRSG